jgi:hypothetical protein
MRLVLKVKVKVSGLPIVKCCRALRSWKGGREGGHGKTTVTCMTCSLWCSCRSLSVSSPPWPLRADATCSICTSRPNRMKETERRKDEKQINEIVVGEMKLLIILVTVTELSRDFIRLKSLHFSPPLPFSLYDSISAASTLSLALDSISPSSRSLASSWPEERGREGNLVVRGAESRWVWRSRKGLCLLTFLRSIEPSVAGIEILLEEKERKKGKEPGMVQVRRCNRH